MTYRKIYISGKDDEGDICKAPFPVDVPRKANTTDKKEMPHRPEIVITERNYNQRQSASKGIFRFSMGKIVGTVLLCALSFTAGCTFTNDSIAEYIKRVASFSFGKTDSGPESSQSSTSEELPTFYNKYMTDQAKAALQAEAVSDTKIEYLSVIQNEEDEILQSEALPVTEVSAGNPGKIGADGDILYSVMKSDMSVSDECVLTNQTKFKPDTKALLERLPVSFENLSVSSDEPLVLIVHTHGTECYNSYPIDGFVSESTAERSENTDENVVAVGRKLAEVLGGFGIPVVHSEKMCDRESFVKAYSTSYSEVQSYLEKYPSIRFVIDLHRDAIELADGTRKKPLLEKYGENYAQLMFVVGTNEAGAKHPNWQENLSLALNLQSEIGSMYPGLFRGINLRTASFNQQLSAGYMLLECGSSANTLEEAENSAVLFATGLAKTITKYAK